MSPHLGNILPIVNSGISPSTRILVGNGQYLPISQIGRTVLSSNPTLSLNNILIAPHLIKRLISVRKFCIDNNCSVEFDPFGFSVKDLASRTAILRCNSQGELYPFVPPQPTTPKAASPILLHASTAPASLWHTRLGHPGAHFLLHLSSQNLIQFSKFDLSICDACQLGKQARLPFYLSNTVSSSPFDLIHCDLWTSPISSVTGFKYFLVIVDDCTHFVWTFPLRYKSETPLHIQQFFQHVHTQFNVTIKQVQCDNGREFNNTELHSFISQKGSNFRFSCPYTSQQNGKAERMIRTLTNMIRSILFHGHLPPCYWTEALTSATHLLNLIPSTTTTMITPFELLHKKRPTYSHLRTIGCLCYPNLTAITKHKLEPRTKRCVFLGYATSHRGYRCLDLSTNKVIISRHVIFDEFSFPFQNSNLNQKSQKDFEFNLDEFVSTHPPISPLIPHHSTTQISPESVTDFPNNSQIIPPESINDSQNNCPIISPNPTIPTRQLHALIPDPCPASLNPKFNLI
ncbi:hypothetical protein V2J09_016970 [Rumex salicifolius]